MLKPVLRIFFNVEQKNVWHFLTTIKHLMSLKMNDKFNEAL